MITELVRNEVRSYKQLPLIFYQIQTKFRDELRPRFGVMRGREFLMKDAYSFHLDQASLEASYRLVYQAYTSIFNRLGLTFRVVEADCGDIGGNSSHEFQVLADSGEDLIAYSETGHYAANMEAAVAEPAVTTPAITESVITDTASPQQPELVATSDCGTISEVAQRLQLPPQRILKTLIVRAAPTQANNQDTVGAASASWVAVVLRGDHQLNETKLNKLQLTATPLEMAPLELLPQLIGCHAGSIGPFHLPATIPLIIDSQAAKLQDFCCGATQDGYHLLHARWNSTQLAASTIADIRQVQEDDIAPDGGRIKLARGIEVGHIFQLGTKYSHALKATVLDSGGHAQELLMGCYGIGVSRTVAAAIEQRHDARGILWPAAIAPFQLVIIPMNLHKSYRVRELAERLHNEFTQLKIEVLLEDRRERAGVIFTDMDLIGIPHRLILSESGIDAGLIEYQKRTDPPKQSRQIPIDQVVQFISEQI